MTETTVTPELLAAVQAQLAATQKPALTVWGQPAVTTAIKGIAVPIKVQTPKGSLRLYLQLGAEAASSPEKIMDTVQALNEQGYPLDTWQKNASFGSFSGNSWKR